MRARTRRSQRATIAQSCTIVATLIFVLALTLFEGKGNRQYEFITARGLHSIIYVTCCYITKERLEFLRQALIGQFKPQDYVITYDSALAI